MGVSSLVTWVIMECNNKSASGREDPEFSDPLSKSMGDGAVMGIRFWGPTEGGEGGDGLAGAGAAAAAGAHCGLAEQLGEGVVLFCSDSVVDSTPSMPWHLIDNPAVQMSGLVIWTLLK